MDRRDTVYATIAAVLNEAGKEGVELDDDAVLVDELGLASLQIARILAVLEVKLGINPFDDPAVSITDIRTVGDLATVFSPTLRT